MIDSPTFLLNNYLFTSRSFVICILLTTNDSFDLFSIFKEDDCQHGGSLGLCAEILVKHDAIKLKRNCNSYMAFTHIDLGEYYARRVLDQSIKLRCQRFAGSAPCCEDVKPNDLVSRSDGFELL